MKRLVFLSMAVVLLTGAPAARADGPDPDDLALLQAVRARFEGLTKPEVVAAGYAPETECVGRPSGMMGWLAEKYPFNEDNLVRATDPEILLLDENSKVMGIEYETQDVSVPRPALFGLLFERTEGRRGKEWPHYALHVHFLPDGAFFIGGFNPARRCPSPPVYASVAEASVELRNADGQVVGAGTLTEDPSGHLFLSVRVSGVPAGAHGFHIHQRGRCDPARFHLEGEHFNPLGREHGLENPSGPHAGDLPNLIIDGRGIGHIRVATDRATVSPGPLTLFGRDGSALVLHTDADDQRTDPTGRSGAHLACGVIELVPAAGPNLAALLQDHYEAVNRGDVAAAAAAFADDAVLRRGNRCPAAVPCVSKAAIQQQLEQEGTLQVRFRIISLRVSGETAAAVVELRNVAIRDAGLKRVIQKHVVAFAGDRIADYAAELDLTDPQSAAFDNVARVTTRSTSRRNLALNRGDLAGVMTTYGDDALFEGLGLCATAPCIGKAAIQSEMEREVADHTTVANDPFTVRVAGDKVTSRAEVGSDSIRATGVARVIATVTAEVKGEKIVFHRIALDPTDPQTAAFLATQAARAQ